MKKTHERLRDLREDSDMTQKELAQIINMSQQQYSRYERGDVVLSVPALISLANHYKLSTDFILGRTQCHESIEGWSQIILDDYTADEMISDMLSLNDTGRLVIREQIKYQKDKNPK